MKTLTGMGGLGNAQELAELLRQMGRGPDSMLAHITPEEAQMLLESGGSGKSTLRQVYLSSNLTTTMT
jgi:hypothetical protein